MIYKIKMDNIDIYEETEELTVLSPSLDIEINTAGSISFCMPKFHSYYNNPVLLSSSVDVYEGDEIIWFGRVVDISTSMNKDKDIYCEGALAYFNDSIQRPMEYPDVSIRTFFRTLITNHNNQVAANRRFTVGNITVPDRYVYRAVNYANTMECIRQCCLDTDGGYLFLRKESNGVAYIDWLKDMPYEGNQPVQYALNLADINQYLSGAEMKTSVIPLGDSVNGVPTDIKSVNSGRDYLDSSLVSSYGRITEVVSFDGVTDPSELQTLGLQWLANRQFDPLTIECSAAELHYLDSTYSPFKVGQTVHVTSTPHFIDREFPITKMSVALDAGVKNITIGTQITQTLTSTYSSGGGSTSGGSNNSGGASGSTSSSVYETDYFSLYNKPRINGNELVGDKTSDELLITGRYTHTQSEPSAEWLVQHCLGEAYPTIHVFDGNGNEVICFIAEYYSSNLTILRFHTEFAGTAEIRK